MVTGEPVWLVQESENPLIIPDSGANTKLTNTSLILSALVVCMLLPVTCRWCSYSGTPSISQHLVPYVLLTHSWHIAGLQLNISKQDTNTLFRNKWITSSEVLHLFSQLDSLLLISRGNKCKYLEVTEIPLFRALWSTRDQIVSKRLFYISKHNTTILFLSIKSPAPWYRLWLL